VVRGGVAPRWLRRASHLPANARAEPNPCPRDGVASPRPQRSQPSPSECSGGAEPMPPRDSGGISVAPSSQPSPRMQGNEQAEPKPVHPRRRGVALRPFHGRLECSARQWPLWSSRWADASEAPEPRWTSGREVLDSLHARRLPGGQARRPPEGARVGSAGLAPRTPRAASARGPRVGSAGLAPRTPRAASARGPRVGSAGLAPRTPRAPSPALHLERHALDRQASPRATAPAASGTPAHPPRSRSARPPAAHTAVPSAVHPRPCPRP
jgi:hypothetical protein